MKFMKKVFMVLSFTFILLLPHSTFAAGVNQACTTPNSTGGGCDTGLYCDNDSTCQAQFGDTQGCNQDYQCLLGYCTNNVCGKPKAGQACTGGGSIGNCASGFYCHESTNTCIVLSPNNTGCQQNYECASTFCGPALTCQPNPTGSSGNTGTGSSGNTGTGSSGNTGTGSSGNSGTATNGADTSYKLENPLGADISIGALIGRIIKYLIGLSGSLALAVFIYGGVMLLVSRGDGKYITKGKTAMINAIVGLAIIFLSYIIIRFIVTLVTGV